WTHRGADVVTLSASVGPVGEKADGTWTWSYVPPNGPASQTVTITATDSDGASTSTPFTLTVTSNNTTPRITCLTSSFSNLAHPSPDGGGTITGKFADTSAHATSVGSWGAGPNSGPTSAGLLAHNSQASHQYGRGGVFTIPVTLTDGGTTVSRTTTAVVTGVGLVDGTLYVVGSERGDDI